MYTCYITEESSCYTSVSVYNCRLLALLSRCLTLEQSLNDDIHV